jgi:hypothetical protein
VPGAAELVRDSQPFFDARFSRQEVVRFFGIELDKPTAAQLACKVADQSNVLSDDSGDFGPRDLGEEAHFDFVVTCRIHLILKRVPGYPSLW